MPVHIIHKTSNPHATYMSNLDEIELSDTTSSSVQNGLVVTLNGTKLKDTTANNNNNSSGPKPIIKFSEYTDADIVDFQFVNQFIKHLPYFNKIKANAFNELELIKTNLAKSVLLNEIRPGLVHWTNRLQTFINEYGLFFSKSDHLRFVRIYLEIIATPDIDLVVVDLCFSILVELLK